MNARLLYRQYRNAGTKYSTKTLAPFITLATRDLKVCLKEKNINLSISIHNTRFLSTYSLQYRKLETTSFKISVNKTKATVLYLYPLSDC